MNAPDRSGPLVELYPDPPFREAPIFPFRVTPTNGYFYLSPKIAIGSGATEVTFIPFQRWRDENYPGTEIGGTYPRDFPSGVCNVLTGEIVGKYYLICPLGFYYHNNSLNYGEDSLASHCQGVDPLVDGSPYRWVFEAPDKDTFRVTLYRVGKDTSVATWDSYNSEDLMTGAPDIRIGYPSAVHLAAIYGNNQVYAPPNEFVITGMRGL